MRISDWSSDVCSSDLLFVFSRGRSDSALIAIAALVVGLAYLTWWEYARPTWTTGTVSGTEVRRSEADARGMTHDIQYVYMRNRADAGVELENEDSWWWFKRNSERVFNDAKTAADRKTEVTAIWNRWRPQLFSWPSSEERRGGKGCVSPCKY